MNSMYNSLLTEPLVCRHHTTTPFGGEVIELPYDPVNCCWCHLSQKLRMELLYGNWPSQEETAKKAKEETQKNQARPSPYQSLKGN